MPERRLSVEAGLGLCLAALLIIPHLHLPGTTIPVRAVAEPACGTGESKVVTYMGGRSSMMLSLLEDGAGARITHGEVEQKRLIGGLPPQAWYRDQVLAFRGRTLLAAYQLDRTDTFAPGPYLTISDVPLSQKNFGKLAVLCVQKDRAQTLFDTAYRRVSSMTVIE